MHSPPRSKYLKQPVRRTRSSSSGIHQCERNEQRYENIFFKNSPSAPKRSYKATLRMLTVDESGFRSQCHLCSAFWIFFQFLRSSTDPRSSRKMTTSFRATVIPPPVNGCRIFHESPMRIAPCFDLPVPWSTGGKNELGIRLRRSFSRAV